MFRSVRQSDQLTGWKWWLVGWLGKALIDLICSTLRVRALDFEKAQAEIKSRKLIGAFWHSRILMISYMYKGGGAAIMVSASRDGEIMAQILRRQGHDTIRGSTSRHGVQALARLIKALREGIRPAVVVPDGPIGPRFKVQPGVITLARKTGYPIVPISYSARRLKVFASWDRFILPYPFTECSVIYGTPVEVPAEAGVEAQELCRKRLEDEMNRITQNVDRYYGHNIY
jgi:lysophospholipid acyltransferase (LPLAT)-like uncharacterized protein